MSKRMIAVVCTLVALAIGSVAWAQPVPVDVVADRPAATLLLPNFVVDLDKPSGKTTIFSINNASATAVLAHVTIWSDLAVPVATFNVYLTGYDVQVINLRDVLNGSFPRTASAGQDPTDTISPKGPFSQDINFASCTGQLPIGVQSAEKIAYMQTVLTGRGSNFQASGGPLRCYGRNFGDNKARGFVTVDTVNNCTLRFPGDVGFFGAGGTGDATNQNVLYGDYALVSPAGGGLGGTLVHVVANSTDPQTSTPGQYTFYGRLVNWLAADNRQPLSTNFFARYSSSPEAGTVLTVWRDPKVNQQNFACNTLPGWYPLGQEDIVIFNEQEQVQLPPICQVGPCPPGPTLAPFGAATQRVEVGGASLPSPFPNGTLFLNLNTTVAQAGANPPEDPAAAQAWVEVSGPRATYNAVRLDSATAASHPGNF